MKNILKTTGKRNCNDSDDSSLSNSGTSIEKIIYCVSLGIFALIFIYSSMVDLRIWENSSVEASELNEEKRSEKSEKPKQQDSDVKSSDIISPGNKNIAEGTDEDGDAANSSNFAGIIKANKRLFRLIFKIVMANSMS